jgi:hypothetical protein
MAQGLLNYPHPTKEHGQRSIDVSDLYLTRWTPPWARATSINANQWRAWVLTQPVAVVCRETLIANLLSLDWKITPRDSTYREELEPTIKHYTKLFSRGGDYASLSLDYSGLIEWIVGDLLDTPFGGAAELGRAGNRPGGRVVWIRPLDAGTLYPTLNEETPIVQYYNQYEAVAFPYWSISRMFMSPHSFILREGWGMAPPEKIYFALEMLNRSDKYYANLLLDIPTAGILDLGDMEKSSAEEWITAFKSFVNENTTAFRVPVLYEHNNPVEFIPFGKVPNDIMFNQITLKYAALVAAGYGMSLSDIGLQTTSASGETLAGSIRQERRTRKTGFARVKAKVKSFFDHILPDSLEFNLVDYDDELNVALGRARLASSQAFASFRQIGVVSPQEVRSQLIQDGLMSISLPDEIPADAKPDPLLSPNGEPEMLQGGKPPSAGGEGEVRALDSVSFKPKSRTLNTFIDDIVLNVSPKLIEVFSSISDDEIEVMKSLISESVFAEDDALEFGLLISTLLKNKSLGTFVYGNLEDELLSLLDDGYENVNLKSFIVTLKSRIRDGLSDFIGRAVLITMLNADSMDAETIKDKIVNSLQEYVSAHVGIETQALLEEIRQQPKVLPDAVRVRSLGRKYAELAPVVQPTSITVNVPEIPNHIIVNTPKQDAPIVNLSVPEAQHHNHIDVHVPEQAAPIINVESPEVYVDVPKQDAPIVNVSVPAQDAPIVHVSNTVAPTPIEIVNPVTVNVPKVEMEVQDVQRDQYGQITRTVKTPIYDDDDKNVKNG